MIDVNELKSQLIDMIPSVICLYSLHNNDNLCFAHPITMGVCVNKSKLFQHCEKLSVDKNNFEERKFEVKNIV